jgi:hypothetical protein
MERGASLWAPRQRLETRQFSQLPYGRPGKPKCKRAQALDLHKKKALYAHVIAM